MTVRKEGSSRPGGSWRQGEVICKSLELEGRRLTLEYYNLDKRDEEFVGEVLAYRPDKEPGDFWWGSGGAVERDGARVYDDGKLHYVDEEYNERVFETPYDKFSISGSILKTRQYVYICSF